MGHSRHDAEFCRVLRVRFAQLVFNGFPLFAYDEQSQYLLIGAVFLLGVLGAIGAGIMPRLMRWRRVSAAVLHRGYRAAVRSRHHAVVQLRAACGLRHLYQPLALLIANFSMGVLTAIGLLGGILAFIPKKTGRHRQRKSPAHSRRCRQPKPAPAVPAAAPKQHRLRLPLCLRPLSRNPLRPPLHRRLHLLRLPPLGRNGADMVSAAQPDAGLTNLE